MCDVIPPASASSSSPWRQPSISPRTATDSPRTRTRISTHLSFINSPSNSIAYELKGHANGDPWKNIVVVYNPNATSITTTLPSGKWTIVATQGKVGEKSLGSASDTVAVPDYSMIVLHQ
jgi:pullulanase